MKPNFYAQKSPIGLKTQKSAIGLKQGPKKVQQLRMVLKASDTLREFICSSGQILITSENCRVYPIPSN